VLRVYARDELREVGLRACERHHGGHSHKYDHKSRRCRVGPSP
jgi:hypothetical protein